MKLKSKILVTGGAGYIVNRNSLQLLNSGYQVTVLDKKENPFDEKKKKQNIYKEIYTLRELCNGMCRSRVCYSFSGESKE